MCDVTRLPTRAPSNDKSQRNHSRWTCKDNIYRTQAFDPIDSGFSTPIADPDLRTPPFGS